MLHVRIPEDNLKQGINIQSSTRRFWTVGEESFLYWIIQIYLF